MSDLRGKLFTALTGRDADVSGQAGGDLRGMLMAVGGAWLMLDGDAGKGIKKPATLKTMEIIGDIATARLAGSDPGGEETHGSAVDLIKRPIEVRAISAMSLIHIYEPTSPY